MVELNVNVVDDAEQRTWMITYQLPVVRRDHEHECRLIEKCIRDDAIREAKIQQVDAIREAQILDAAIHVGLLGLHLMSKKEPNSQVSVYFFCKLIRINNLLN